MTTAVSLGLYALLLTLDVHYPLALALAYAAGIIVGYETNRRWTFSAGRHQARYLARYVAIQGLGFVANVLVLIALVSRLGLPPLPAQLLSLTLIFGGTFALHRTWTFVHPSRG